MIIFLIILLVVFHVIFISKNSFAQKSVAEGDSAIALYIENDSPNMGGPGSDQAYTNGLKLSYIYANNQIPDWAEKPTQKLKFLGECIISSKVNYGLSIGHQIFGPNNTDCVELITADRPYAAWLYGGFAVSLIPIRLNSTNKPD